MSNLQNLCRAYNCSLHVTGVMVVNPWFGDDIHQRKPEKFPWMLPHIHTTFGRLRGSPKKKTEQKITGSHVYPHSFNSRQFRHGTRTPNLGDNVTIKKTGDCWPKKHTPVFMLLQHFNPSWIGSLNDQIYRSDRKSLHPSKGQSLSHRRSSMTRATPADLGRERDVFTWILCSKFWLWQCLPKLSLWLFWTQVLELLGLATSESRVVVLRVVFATRIVLLAAHFMFVDAWRMHTFVVFVLSSAQGEQTQYEKR